MSTDLMKFIAAVVMYAAWGYLVSLGKTEVGPFVGFTMAALGAILGHSSASVSRAVPSIVDVKQGGFARPILLAIIALLAGLTLLAGCAGVPITSANNPIGAFTLQDAKGASALAQQRNDSAGQKCYDYIAGAIEAASAVPFTPGLLYLNEVRRTAAGATAGLATACAGVLPIMVGL